MSEQPCQYTLSAPSDQWDEYIKAELWYNSALTYPPHGIYHLLCIYGNGFVVLCPPYTVVHTLENQS